MIVELSDELAEELRVTLANVISDMSSEVADTDNPDYRRQLQARRVRLQSIVESLKTVHSVDRTSASAEVPASKSP